MKHLKTKPITDFFTNCTLRLEPTYKHAYQFTGDSMLDHTRHSILDADILEIGQEDLIDPIIKSSFQIKTSDIFVFRFFKSGGVIAKISNYNPDSETFLLNFLNPNKEQFPDILIHADDIKSIFKVTETIQLRQSMNSIN